MLKHQGPLYEEAGAAGSTGPLLTTTAGSQSTTTTTAPALPPDPAKWREFLSDEFKVHPVLKDYKDANALAKSHVNLQKLLGGDKIPAPKDDWTAEQWNELYARLGRPESPDKYAFKVAEGFPVDDPLLKDMTAIMHASGLSTKQVAAVLEGYSGKVMGHLANEKTQQAKAAAETTAALQKEYGDKFEEQLNYARYAVKELGDEALIKALNETHLTNSAPLVKLMAKAGRLLASDRASGQAATGSFGDNMSPAEAQAALSSLMADPNNVKAMMDKDDVRHDEVINRRMRLFQLASPRATT